MVAATAGTKSKLTLKTTAMNTIRRPRKNPIGMSSEVSMRNGFPTAGNFAIPAMLRGIIASNIWMSSKPMNAPKTDFQCPLRNLRASPTEKKMSPRSCSMVILEATVLAKKKMHAKLTIPTHIAISVVCVSPASPKGGSGRRAYVFQKSCTAVPPTLTRLRYTKVS